jgi:hypothetical protein
VSTALARAVAMEWVKVRTTKAWWGVLLILVGLVVVNVLPTAALLPREIDPDSPSAFGAVTAASAEGQRTILGAGFQSAYLISAVLGTIVGAVDFRHRTATWTFLVVPGRTPVAVAKLVVAGAFGVVYGITAQLLSLGLSRLVLGIRGITAEMDADTWRALALGVLGVAVWAVVGAAVGLLLRNQIAAILVAIGWIFLIDPIGSLVAGLVPEVGGVDLSDIVAYSPGNASTAIVQGFTGSDLLPWWAGLLVLLGYAAVFTVISVAVSPRRDLT